MKILFWWPHSERDSNWAPISRVVDQVVSLCAVPRMLMLDPRPVCLGFVVEEVGLGQVSLRVFRFLMSVSFHQYSILISLRRYAILRIESVVKWHTLKNRALVEYICKLLPLLQHVRQNLRNWQPLTSTSRYVCMLCFLTTHCSLRLIVRSELDIQTFTTRRFHAYHHARAPSGRRWNCGEKCPGILPKCRITHYN
jgi:hypothetical protein